MSINSINGGYNAATSTTTNSSKNTTKDTTSSTASSKNDAAAVYEKSSTDNSSSTNKLYNRDAIVSQLKVDQQSRMESMQNLVNNILGKQANKFSFANSTNIADTFRSISDKIDQSTIDEAKESISANGYWGVEKTSDRLVSMAIALSGGDTSKADTLIDAIKEGYNKATDAWGEELPQISKDTLAATLQKMDDWKTGKTSAADYAS